MLVDRVGNIENTVYERDSDVIASLECQNKFLAAEVKTLSLKFENLEKKAKADEAMNIHANIIPSHKTTHADNKRVASIDIYLSGLLARRQNAWSQDGGNMRVIANGVNR